jgi:hypothetical protein
VGKSCSTHVRMRNAHKIWTGSLRKQTTWETYVQIEGYLLRLTGFVWLMLHRLDGHV